jgi:hypothetical protein
LVEYFGNGSRSAYLRATLRVMRSVMLAEQLREFQAYGQQRTAELGIESADVSARVQEFLKDDQGRGCHSVQAACTLCKRRSPLGSAALRKHGI